MPQPLGARYLDSNIPGTASQVCILLWAEFPWIFPGPGVTNEGWQQLISYQINDRQAFQLLHSPHSLSTSGPWLGWWRWFACFTLTDIITLKWFQHEHNKQIKCSLVTDDYPASPDCLFVTNAPPRVASFLGIFSQFHWEPGSGCWC